MSQSHIVLRSGFNMPLMGLGTNLGKDVNVANIVEAGLKTGYRHIDCSYLNLNEKLVGNGIRSAIEKGIVKREDLFITSKLWCTCYRKDLVKACLQETLRDLGLDYLDLYLIHTPFSLKQIDEYIPRDDPRFEDSMVVPMDGNDMPIPGNVDVIEPWKVLEECVKEGLVRSLGVSNFNSEQLQELFAQAEVKPSVLQIECHPYQSQVPLVNFCRERDVAVVAYSPLGGPENVPTTFCTIIDRIHDDKHLSQIAKRYGKTPAQGALRFNIQRHIAVIPRTSKETRLCENFAVFDFELTEDEMKTILALNQNVRYASLSKFKNFSRFPFNIPF